MLVVGILVATMVAGILGQLLLEGTSAGSGPHATFLRLLMGLLGLQVSGLGLIHVFLRQHGHGWASGFGLRMEPRAMAWGVAMAAASVRTRSRRAALTAATFMAGPSAAAVTAAGSPLRPSACRSGLARSAATLAIAASATTARLHAAAAPLRIDGPRMPVMAAAPLRTLAWDRP
jgi:hypothetical protein